MVFNATFNNSSAISWQSVLLVEETGAHRENHCPPKPTVLYRRSQMKIVYQYFKKLYMSNEKHWSIQMLCFSKFMRELRIFVHRIKLNVGWLVENSNFIVWWLFFNRDKHTNHDIIDLRRFDFLFTNQDKSTLNFPPVAHLRDNV